ELGLELDPISGIERRDGVRPELRVGLEDERVLSLPAIERIGAIAADQFVLPPATVERIGPAVADQLVFPLEAVKSIGLDRPLEDVVLLEYLLGDLGRVLGIDDDAEIDIGVGELVDDL